MAEAAYITEEELNSLAQEQGLFAVDFTAAWCGPCKVIGPHIDRLATEYEGQAKVVKFDIDLNREVLKRFGLRGIPAVLFFKAGTLLDSVIGVADYARLKSVLEAGLAADPTALAAEEA